MIKVKNLLKKRIYSVFISYFIACVTEASEMDIDIIPYLSKDDSGKVLRGQFHDIKNTPNSLGRLVINVVTQLFVQSRGGGNLLKKSY